VVILVLQLVLYFNVFQNNDMYCSCTVSVHDASSVQVRCVSVQVRCVKPSAT
jgi:hypothetical protein